MRHPERGPGFHLGFFQFADGFLCGVDHIAQPVYQVSWAVKFRQLFQLAFTDGCMQFVNRLIHQIEAAALREDLNLSLRCLVCVYHSGFTCWLGLARIDIK